MSDVTKLDDSIPSIRNLASQFIQLNHRDVAFESALKKLNDNVAIDFERERAKGLSIIDKLDMLQERLEKEISDHKKLQDKYILSASELSSLRKDTATKLALIDKEKAAVLSSQSVDISIFSEIQSEYLRESRKIDDIIDMFVKKEAKGLSWEVFYDNGKYAMKDSYFAGYHSEVDAINIIKIAYLDEAIKEARKLPLDQSMRIMIDSIDRADDSFSRFVSSKNITDGQVMDRRAAIAKEKEEVVAAIGKEYPQFHKIGTILFLRNYVRDIKLAETTIQRLNSFEHKDADRIFDNQSILKCLKEDFRRDFVSYYVKDSHPDIYESYMSAKGMYVSAISGLSESSAQANRLEKTSEEMREKLALKQAATNNLFRESSALQRTINETRETMQKLANELHGSFSMTRDMLRTLSAKVPLPGSFGENELRRLHDEKTPKHDHGAGYQK